MGLVAYVLDDFAAWWDANRPEDTGYYVDKDGPIYGGGRLSADVGFEHLEKTTEQARRKHPRDPLAEAGKREILWELFDAIPRDWPRKRRLYLSNSISRYLAELD